MSICFAEVCLCVVAIPIVDITLMVCMCLSVCFLSNVHYIDYLYVLQIIRLYLYSIWMSYMSGMPELAHCIFGFILSLLLLLLLDDALFGLHFVYKIVDSRRHTHTKSKWQKIKIKSEQPIPSTDLFCYCILLCIRVHVTRMFLWCAVRHGWDVKCLWTEMEWEVQRNEV